MKTNGLLLVRLQGIQDVFYRTCMTLFILGTVMLFCIPEYREDWVPDFLYPLAVAADVSSGTCTLILIGGMISGTASFCLERIIEMIEAHQKTDTEESEKIEMYLK